MNLTNNIRVQNQIDSINNLRTFLNRYENDWRMGSDVREQLFSELETMGDGLFKELKEEWKKQSKEQTIVLDNQIDMEL